MHTCQRARFRFNPKPLTLALTVLLLIFSPSLLASWGMTTSLAGGTILSATFAIIFALAIGLSSKKTQQNLLFATIAFVTIAIHLIAISVSFKINILHSLTSTFALLILGTGSLATANLLLKCNPNRTTQILKGVFYFLLCLGAWGAIGFLQPFSGIYEKPVFPYTEPSHYALIFTPFLIFSSLVSSSPIRLLYILIAVAITLSLQNLTLLIGCILSAAITLRGRHILYISLPLILGVYFAVDINYYTDRLQLNADTQNLSALVYMQGWALVEESWRSTYGLGRGFQQLGYHDISNSATAIIYTLTDKQLNIYDGGFNAAKMLSEFGALGAIILICYVILALRSFSALKSIEIYKDKPAVIWAYSVIVAYSIEVFVRGAGYFTPTGLLLLASIWILHWQKCGTRQHALTAEK